MILKLWPTAAASFVFLAVSVTSFFFLALAASFFLVAVSVASFVLVALSVVASFFFLGENTKKNSGNSGYKDVTEATPGEELKEGRLEIISSAQSPPITKQFHISSGKFPPITKNVESIQTHNVFLDVRNPQYSPMCSTMRSHGYYVTLHMAMELRNKCRRLHVINYWKSRHLEV